MKNLKIIVYVLILFVFFSCGKKVEKNVIFSGKIENPVSDSVSILSLKTRELVQVIKLSDSCTFADTFKIDKGLYYLSYGNEFLTIYFEPGFDFSLTFDSKEFDNTIKYVGKGAEENNLLLQKHLFQIKLAETNIYDSYKKPEKEFLKYVDSIYNVEIEIINKVEITNKQFLGFVQNWIELDKYTKIFQYEPYHQYFTKDTAFKVSANYPKVEDIIDLNDEKMIALPDYTRLVLSIYQNKIHYENNETYYIDWLNVIADEATNDSVKQELATFLARSSIQYTNELDEFFDKYNSIVTYKKYKDEIAKKYEKLLEIAPGKKSPDFSFENLDGDMISLADLSGKIVFIDVWAVWCNPCVKEIPFLEELKTKFVGEDIVFVSVDVADEISNWKAFLEKKKMTNLQLRADSWDIDFMKKYLITGIPRFIILDKEGYIIDNNSIRPSNPKIESKLRDLLK